MLLRSTGLLIGFLLLWALIAYALHLPSYILPGPYQVLQSLWHEKALLLQQSYPTLIEIFWGWLLGILLGFSTAFAMVAFRGLKHWLLPLVLLSQAIPSFAIAPILVLWLGYGVSSKIAVTVLILFFPVTSSFYDGLKNTPLEWLELAKTLGASPLRTLIKIRLPAALPQLASGIRLATAFAPMGAIIGEWVGSSKGLGFLILNANARMEISLMFACLTIIVFLTLAFYIAVDKLLEKLLPWQKER